MPARVPSDVSSQIDSVVELFRSSRALSTVKAKLYLSSDAFIIGCEGDPLDIFGVDGATLRTLPNLLTDRLHTADLPLLKSTLDALATEAELQTSLRIRGLDGKIQVYAARFSSRPHGIEVAFIDTRAAAYQMGTFAKSLARAVMEASDDHIFVKDGHHVLITASRSLAAMCKDIDHWSEFAGRTDYEVFPEDLADQFYELEIPIYRGGNSARELQTFQRRDGSKGWIDNRKYPIKDADEKTIGLFGIARDVTDQVNAAQTMALSASVFDNSSEGIVITDLDGQILQANGVFFDKFNVPRESIIGCSLAVLQRNAGYEITIEDAVADLLVTGAWQGEIERPDSSGQSGRHELARYSTVSDEEGRAHHFIGLYSDITDVKKHERELKQMAHYDELTGLPNRSLLSDRLEQSIALAQRRKSHVAVAYIDIDGFKQINDTHGHETGDRFLRAIGVAMQHALRDTDTLARIGGDEFVAVIADMDDPYGYLHVVARLLAAASSPVYLDESTLACSASIGVACFPNDGAEPDLLMRRADQAMYQAKQDGKNTVSLFGVESDRDVVSREEIESGMGAGEFELHYHPKLNLSSGEILGVEALARWRHPHRGLLMPADFLSAVVRENLEIVFGEWVLKSAVKQLSKWRASGLQIPVSINVSPRHLKRRDFYDSVGIMLERYELTGEGLLQLEVLETTQIDDLVYTGELINRLTNLGVSVALDDFGTGFSSLTYLRSLPVDIVKIDQTFVQNLLADEEDRSIVSSIISLCEVLKRTVLAEGVSSVEHARTLVDMGCQYGQGYGIALPMPARELEVWVRDWHARGRSQWIEALNR